MDAANVRLLQFQQQAAAAITEAAASILFLADTIKENPVDFAKTFVGDLSLLDKLQAKLKAAKEFTEQERRELVIAPLTPPRPPTAPTTLRAKVPSRIELEPPSPPAFALGPGQLPPRPAKVVPPVKKEAAPAQKPSASVKKMAVSAKKVSVAKKTTFAVKAAIAPSAPTQKIASKKVAPAKNAPAKKK